MKFREFPKCLGIWEIPQIREIPDSGVFEIFKNFPNVWVSGKFLKCLGFWEIPQIYCHLRNLQNFLKYKFSKCLGIWEIPQIPEISVGI